MKDSNDLDNCLIVETEFDEFSRHEYNQLVSTNAPSALLVTSRGFESRRDRQVRQLCAITKLFLFNLPEVFDSQLQGSIDREINREA